MKLVDAHCHLNDAQYSEDMYEIIQEINEKLEFAVCSGWDYESSLKAIEIAEKNEKIYASIGFHPTDISTITAEKLKHIEKLAKEHKKVVAIGEIGLDYHWMKDPKEVQKKYFIEQIELIRRVDIPIVVHTREALADTIEILDSYKDVGGVLHCFPGSYESVVPILDRYYVNVGGTLTFKNNRKTKDLVDKISIEKLLIETDSPYLTPVPYRGRRNKPTYVELVAQEIANIKNMSYEDVVNITTENAIRVYRMRERIWK